MFQGKIFQQNSKQIQQKTEHHGFQNVQKTLPFLMLLFPSMEKEMKNTIS